MRRIRISTLCTIVAAAALVGCASSVKLDEKAPVESRTGTPVTGAGGAAGAGANAGANTQSGVATVNLPPGQAGSSTVGRVVYFDFDSFVIKDEFRPVIETHARALAAAKNKRMVIEGHTDERGGREYNLALGQKRAEAVLKALVLVGAGENQLEAVSFGKERPAVVGSDEAAWAMNRRAELKDR